MSIHSKKFEAKVLKLGEEIFEDIGSNPASIFDPNFFTDKFLELGMRDEELKVPLFHFVDVLPNLDNPQSVLRHVREYFTPLQGKIPELLRRALEIDPGSVAAKVIARVIRQQVRMVAKRFIVGDSAVSSLNSLQEIRKNGLCFTVDLVGEAAVSEEEASAYQQRYLELLETLSQEVPNWAESKAIVADHRCEQTPINISVKLSALYSQTKPISTEDSIAVLTKKLTEIATKAKQVGAFVYVDMEDTALTTITLETFKRVFSLPEFADYDRCGIVLQAYLRRTGDDFEDLLSWAKDRGTSVAVRLVKGAYWDTETIHAMQHGWPIPVWQHKSCSDANYEELSIRLLENHEHLVPAFGSHNIRSLCHAVVAAEELGASPRDFELQTLYGMGDPIKAAFAKRGYLIREYAPVGELIPGMGYLVRRLLENTSNEGFLRQSFHDQADISTLLAEPQFVADDTGEDHIPEDWRSHFSNAAPCDFSIAANRQALKEQISELRSHLSSSPEQVRAIIEGEEEGTNKTFASISPENPGLKLADVSASDIALADRALEGLTLFAAEWKNTPVAERAAVLFRGAELMDHRRNELSALIVLEAGKPWAEADADVIEAIDFLNYYAHQALQLFETRTMGNLPGETNTYFYEPRGVALVVSPWNFPLAIACGMLSAALVTGNTAVLKPAEQTSLVAKRLFEILVDAGLPERAAAFIPGVGEEVGAYLVSDPRISTIAFTGSKDVGLSIVGEAAEVRPGAVHVKRAIAEMGGKNSIIIDDDADLDEAVKGVVYSAFGFQGQKCSACSKVVVHETCFERFTRRLARAVESIAVGPASDPKTFVGPVIDSEAHERILRTIAKAKEDCSVLAEGQQPDDAKGGYYVPPIVFSEIPEEHPIVTNEIFGPVLAVLKAKDFSSALDIARDSEYGLTGAVYSRSPAHVQKAIRDFDMGNLYINRPSTGAIVMRQPFGGAKMSGIGSKAGGPDYLLQFVIPRTISENTMRRGFAPLP